MSREINQSQNWTTEREREAYYLGRQNKRLDIINFIQEWDGDCSDEFGQLLYQTFQRLQDKDFFKQF